MNFIKTMAREQRGGCWVQRLVRLCSSLFVERGQRLRYRIISIGGTGNRIPHGHTVTPKVGWGTVECFSDEPRGLRPQTRLASESFCEPAPEWSVAAWRANT